MENIVSYTSGGKNYPVATDVEAVSFSKLGLSSTEGLIGRYNMDEILKGTGREIIDCEDAVRILEERLGKTLSVGSQVEWTNKRTSEYFRFEKTNEGWTRCDVKFLYNFYDPKFYKNVVVEFHASPTQIVPNTDTEIKYTWIAYRKNNTGEIEDITHLFNFYPQDYPKTLNLPKGASETFWLEFDCPALGIPRKRRRATIVSGIAEKSKILLVKFGKDRLSEVIDEIEKDKIITVMSSNATEYYFKSLASYKFNLSNECFLVLSSYDYDSIDILLNGTSIKNSLRLIAKYSHPSEYDYFYLLEDPVTLHNSMIKFINN